MPALSNTWTTKTVKITYRNPLTLIKESGSWIVETTGRVTNTLADGTKQVFRPGKISQGTLNIIDGAPSLQVDVPVIDDPDNTPQGGSIRLTVAFTNGGSEVFTLYPLSNWQSVTDIGNLLDPVLTPGVATYVIKGVPGGVAALDSDGDVIDAGGNKVVGNSSGGLTTEQIQDMLSNFLVAGSNTSLIYNDSANTLTINSTATGGGSSYTDEQVRDVIGSALNITGGYLSLNVNDANDTITIGTTQALVDTLAGKAALAHSHNASDINAGTLALSRACAGTSYKLIWNEVGKIWTYAGTGSTAITGRFFNRTDLYIDFIGGRETDRPSWGNVDGDTQEVTLI